MSLINQLIYKIIVLRFFDTYYLRKIQSFYSLIDEISSPNPKLKFIHLKLKNLVNLTLSKILNCYSKNDRQKLYPIFIYYFNEDFFFQ